MDSYFSFKWQYIFTVLWGWSDQRTIFRRGVYPAGLSKASAKEPSVAFALCQIYLNLGLLWGISSSVLNHVGQDVLRDGFCTWCCCQRGCTWLSCTLFSVAPRTAPLLNRIGVSPKYFTELQVVRRELSRNSAKKD